MRIAAKIFIIIGTVTGAPLIFPLILGIFAYNKINATKSSDELKGWGVITLLFVNFLGGIFMLCIKDDDLKRVEENYRDETDGESGEGEWFTSGEHISIKSRNLRGTEKFIMAELFDEL